VSRVKQDSATALSAAKREFEDNIWTHKNQMDDLFKTSKAAHSEEILRLREDTR
jgi:hypothetical protein